MAGRGNNISGVSRKVDITVAVARAYLQRSEGIGNTAASVVVRVKLNALAMEHVITNTAPIELTSTHLSPGG